MHPRTLISLPFLSVFLMTSGSAAWAQPSSSPSGSIASDPTVRLNRADCRTLQGALQALVTRARVTFVVEGRPHTTTLPDSQIPASLEDGLSLPETIAKIAAAYGYGVERRGNIFLLRKLYKSPDDLPGVTMEECALSVADVARVLQPFDTGMGGMLSYHPSMRQLVASLTPEQLARMGSGKSENGKTPLVCPVEKALPLAALNPRQQQVVRQFALRFYTQDAVDSSKRVAAEIKQIAEEGAVFGWGEISGVRYLGYELPQAPKGSRLIPLSNPGQVRRDTQGGVVALTRAEQGGVVLEPPPDPTVPAAVAGKDDPSAGPTLKEAVAALAARNGGGMEVDEALAAKPVLVIGGEHEAPASLLRALADVYGLHLKTREDGALQVTRRPRRVPVDVRLLREAVQRALPDPVLRALHVAPTDTTRTHGGVASTPPWVSAGDTGKQRPPQQIELSRWPAADAIRNAAVRELRAHIEPEIKAAPDGRVPVSALSRRARMAFATVLMMDYLHALNRVLRHPVPAIVTESDRLHLTGGLLERNGEQRFALFLGVPTPDGRHLIAGSGVSMLWRRGPE